MVAEINIIGRIGFDQWNRSAVYTDLEVVKSQFEAVENPTELLINIKSPGGDVLEGFAIYDFLVSQGLPITTVGQLVGSIATVIFLSGDQGKRYLRPNARFLIHNPMPAIGIQTDAEGYERLAAQLRKEENELIGFYNQRTGIDTNTLKALMDKEDLMTAKEAVNMGFADAIQKGKMIEEPVPSQAIYQSRAFDQQQFQVINSIINKSDMNADSKMKAFLLALSNLFKNEIEDTQPAPEAPEAIKQEETAPVDENIQPEKTELEKRIEALEAKQAEALKEKENEIAELKTQLETAQTEQDKLVTAVNLLENMPVAKGGAQAKPTPAKDASMGWIDEQGLTAYFKALINERI